MNGLEIFFNDRILGPNRLALLSDGIHDDHQTKSAEHAEAIAASQRAVADVIQRQERILRQVEDASPAASANDAFTNRLHARYNELEADRHALQARQTALLNAAPPASHPSRARELLRRLPQTKLKITSMTEPALRDLCEAFRIKITYDRISQTSRFEAEVGAVRIDYAAKTITPDNVRVCDVPPG